MKLADFHFDLPDELIARFPAEERTGSRLLLLDGDSGRVVHHQFPDLLDLLEPGDLLVFNNTKVIPARLWGRKSSGGRIEVLVERVTESDQVLAHVRASKAPKPGSELWLQADQHTDAVVARVEVLARQDDLFALRFLSDDDKPADAMAVMKAIGHMPLPPYIDRDDVVSDKERYQTVYGEHEGAVAAPTAGLHFTEAFIEQCHAKGIDSAFVTLHVGAGTFQPVRAENIAEHKMHTEFIHVDQAVCDKVAACRAGGGRVVAVGTTAVRSLETASQTGVLKPFKGDSDIFIYPGYRFNSVDIMLTNFHLPESTLIMLVSAFAGSEQVLNAYREAVRERYRFFSYGDAMLVYPAADCVKR